MLNWIKQLFQDNDNSRTPVAPAAQQPEALISPKAAPGISTVPWRQRDQVDYVFSSWLFEAEQDPDVFTNRNEDNILAAIDETVKSVESGAHLVRRMPGVIPQLLQSLRNPEFSSAEVASTIESDVVLVAEVLRMANSAAYNPGTPIGGIDHAVLVLGQNGLRQLITGVAFKPIINLKSGAFTRMVAPRLWLQSERCGFACRTLARDEPVDPLDAFLVGLIQNIGLTVSLRVIDKISDGRLPVGSPTFCNALAAHGRTLAVNIAREWHFPESVVNAIREQGSDPRDSKVSPVGRILLMGDYLSKIDILARHQRMNRDDKLLTEDLSDKELACMEELALQDDQDWAALANSSSGLR
jgi:HD-like signal output (HDOD) protein